MSKSRPSNSLPEMRFELSQLIERLDELEEKCLVYEAEAIANAETLSKIQPFLGIIDRLGLSDMTTAEIEQLVFASEQIRGYITS